MARYEKSIDVGCDISRSCLNCPLAECKYIDPAGYHRYRRQEKVGRMRAALAIGQPIAEIAQSEGVGVRRALHLLAVPRRKPSA